MVTNVSYGIPRFAIENRWIVGDRFRKVRCRIVVSFSRLSKLIVNIIFLCEYQSGKGSFDPYWWCSVSKARFVIEDQ